MARPCFPARLALKLCWIFICHPLLIWRGISALLAITRAVRTQCVRLPVARNARAVTSECVFNDRLNH